MHYSDQSEVAIPLATNALHYAPITLPNQRIYATRDTRGRTNRL